MKHVLEGLQKESIQTEPFAHVVRTATYSDGTDDRLLRAYPNLEIITQGDEPQNNKRYSYNAKDVFENPAIDPVWKEFIRLHTSREFFLAFVDLFEEDIYRAYPDFKEKFGDLRDFRVGVRNIDSFEDKDILLDAQICINTPVTEQSSVKIAHVDRENKLLTGLLYLRLPEDTLKEAGDLSMYKYATDTKVFHGQRLIDQKYVKKVGEVKYAKNTLILFPDTIDALHGVEPREVTEIPRLFANFIGEVNGDLFDLQPFMKKNLKSRLKQIIIGS